MNKFHCLVCDDNFDIPEVGTRKVEQLSNHEMWSVFCSYFNLNPEEWKQTQNSYNNNGQDNLPFCQKCLVIVESLLDCHNKLQSLQQKIQHTVAHLSVNILQLHNNSNSTKNNEERENDQLVHQIQLMRKNIAQSYQPHVILPHSNNKNVIMDKQKSSMTVDHQSNNNNNNNNDERKEQKRNADNMNTTTSTLTNSTTTFTSTAQASSSSDNSINSEHLYHSNNKKAKNNFFNGGQVSILNSNPVLENTTENRYPSSNFMSIDPEPFYSNMNTNSRFVKCPKCHKPFPHVEDLKRHTTLRSCGDVFPPIIDITNKWHWIVDPKTGQKSWFYDAVWPVEILTGSKGEIKYKCGSCLTSSGISNSREVIGDHIYLVHIAPNSILCPEPGCGRACSSSYHLELHKATAHTYKPYKCNQCDLSFKLESTLTFHKKLIHKPKELEVVEIPQPGNQQGTPAPKLLARILKREQFLQNTATTPPPPSDFDDPHPAFPGELLEVMLDPFDDIQFKNESDVIVPEVKNPYENFYDEGAMEEGNQSMNVNINENPITMNNPNIIIKESPDVIDLTFDDDEENENDVIVVKEEGIFFYKRWSYVHAEHEGGEVFGCLTCGEMIMGHENTVSHIQIKHENSPDKELLINSHRTT